MRVHKEYSERDSAQIVHSVYMIDVNRKPTVSVVVLVYNGGIVNSKQVGALRVCEHRRYSLIQYTI